MKVRIFETSGEYDITYTDIKGENVEDCIRKFVLTHFEEFIEESEHEEERDRFDRVLEDLKCNNKEELKKVDKVDWFYFLDKKSHHYCDFRYVNLIKDIETNEIYYQSYYHQSYLQVVIDNRE